MKLVQETDANEVELKDDGTWAPVASKWRQRQQVTSTTILITIVVTLIVYTSCLLNPMTDCLGFKLKLHVNSG